MGEEAAIQMRVHGPCDNHAFFQEYLGINPLFKTLIFTEIGLYPFTQNYNHRLIATMIQFAGIDKGFFLNLAINTDDIYALTLAESIGPCINLENIADQAISRENLMAYVRALVRSPRLGAYSAGSQVDFLIDIAAVPAESSFHEDRNGLRVRIQELGAPVAGDWPVNNEIPSPEAAIRVLFYLAKKVLPGSSRTNLGLIAHIIVSVTKRGVVSQRFIDRIINGISDDLGVHIQLNDVLFVSLNIRNR